MYLHPSQTKKRTNSIRLERNAASGTMGFTKWLREAKSKTPPKTKIAKALDEAPLEMNGDSSDGVAEESDDALEESPQATQVKRFPLHSHTFL